MAAAAVNSSSGTQKVCFNSNCKAVLERVNKGWRRRTGEFAELCDRCSSVYEAGNFCETFHINSSGWRCCESCGKQIHCGCIVSFHMFVLLDPGGIECLTCARKSFILTPNPAWPPPSLFLPVQPERIKEISTRNWPAIVGSGPVPWRQAPSVFNATSVQSDLQSRMPIEVDRHRFHERLSSPPIEKRKMEESLDRLMNGSLKISCSGVIGGGATVAKSVEQPTSSLNHFQQTANSKTLGSTSALVSISKPETENHHPMVAGTTAPRPTVVYPQAEKRSSGKNQADVSQTEKRSSSQNQADISQTERRSSGQNQADISQTEKRSSGQNQADVSEAQPCNGKARGGDVRGRGQLLPRYWPRISEEELQKISQHSNSVITPLFEKMLSASDAGRIGRLVLPKKCAEAYFPPISQPEGVPLKIQDLKGQEWVFQFRFWPNNNSRMYVLEGIMPCIQSMQLQAGDIVTFSRIEPEGKLVMGCRKAFTEKGNETSSQKPSLNVEGMDKGKKVGEPGPTMQVDATSPPSLQPPPSQQTTEPAVNALYEADKHGVDVGKANTSVRGKRKNSTVGLKRKRLRIDSEDAFELKVSWDQVQGLLRPSADKVATVCVVEGCEFEEFAEGAPVIGRPTIPESDRHGKKVQWVQCEKCFKWRKVPTDVLLISQWTCSDNLWDPPRSRCSAEEELTAEKLETLITTTSNGPSEKTKKDPTPDPEILEAIEGLDALAELAIQEKAASSLSSPSQQPPTSSKHPRHKPGCSCIVCIQPPSGKGPKHKQPCDCVVCKSVKRRFETLMLKREQKLSSSEKEPEPELGPESGGQSSEIDLNIQPHKDDRLGKGIITVMKKEMQRMSKTSPENIENSGEDWRLAGGVIMNKEMQQTPKLSPENIENSGEDRLAGGIIMNKEMQQTPKMPPENIEKSGEDRLAGGIITSKDMQQTTQKMSTENTENSGAGVTKEMPQRLPEYINGIGHNNGDISSPNGIVVSVTPAD